MLKEEPAADCDCYNAMLPFNGVSHVIHCHEWISQGAEVVWHGSQLR